VKNLDKDNFACFRIEKISWDVHWQTDLYLAVIIRDYLRFFIKNTMAIGNCVIDDPSFLNEPNYVGDDEYSKRKNAENEEKSEYYFQKWKDLVNSVADEFDELIKMMLMDGPEIGDYQEFNKKQKALEKKAFSDLAEIFDDLRW
jgi:hypothetical protein